MRANELLDGSMDISHSPPHGPAVEDATTENAESGGEDSVQRMSVDGAAALPQNLEDANADLYAMPSSPPYFVERATRRVMFADEDEVIFISSDASDDRGSQSNGLVDEGEGEAECPEG